MVFGKMIKANDIAGSVTEEQTQMIRDFGMFGMQVPEEYEGMTLMGNLGPNDLDQTHI